MINNKTIEICIGHAQDAIAAAKYPIDRIELNSALELGGLTPSVETLKYVKERIETKICCMVRCRPGDFCYNNTEYEIMLKEAKALLEAGADGIVFGYLNADNSVNITETQKMVELIHTYHKEAVFHKASDCFLDMDQGFKDLVDCHIDRVLTGGGKEPSQILEGCKVIKDLRDKYEDKLEFLVGGGVRITNIQDIINISGTRQIHMTAKRVAQGNYLEFDEEQLLEMFKKIEAI